MPASFDDRFTIDGNGHIDPKGPLGTLVKSGMTNDDKNKVHIHFWATQQQGGMSGAFMQGQAMLDPGDVTRWKTRTPDQVSAVNQVTGQAADFELRHRHGSFKPGYAFAQAVAFVDPDELEWWATTVLLEQ